MRGMGEEIKFVVDSKGGKGKASKIKIQDLIFFFDN